jgi:hypothetical protein
MSGLPEMYAMFPMIAVQRYLGESDADTRFDDQRQQDTFLDVGRWRYFFHGWRIRAIPRGVIRTAPSFSLRVLDGRAHRSPKTAGDIGLVSL